MVRRTPLLSPFFSHGPDPVDCRPLCVGKSGDHNYSNRRETGFTIEDMVVGMGRPHRLLTASTKESRTQPLHKRPGLIRTAQIRGAGYAAGVL